VTVVAAAPFLLLLIGACLGAPLEGLARRPNEADTNHENIGRYALRRALGGRRASITPSITMKCQSRSLPYKPVERSAAHMLSWVGSCEVHSSYHKSCFKASRDARGWSHRPAHIVHEMPTSKVLPFGCTTWMPIMAARCPNGCTIGLPALFGNRVGHSGACVAQLHEMLPPSASALQRALRSLKWKAREWR
jgi:hypothetical protein